MVSIAVFIVQTTIENVKIWRGRTVFERRCPKCNCESVLTVVGKQIKLSKRVEEFEKGG